MTAASSTQLPPLEPVQVPLRHLTFLMSVSWPPSRHGDVYGSTPTSEPLPFLIVIPSSGDGEFDAFTAVVGSGGRGGGHQRLREGRTSDRRSRRRLKIFLARDHAPGAAPQAPPGRVVTAPEVLRVCGRRLRRRRPP